VHIIKSEIFSRGQISERKKEETEERITVEAILPSLPEGCSQC